MKSPHLLSTVHDLLILHTICSIVTKKKDFITTQNVVSQYSADSFMIAFPTNHALMQHSACLSRVGPTDTVNASMDLSHHRRYSRSHCRNFCISCLGFDSPQQKLLTTSPTEPSIGHVCTIGSPEFHFTPQSHSSQSYQLPPPSSFPTPNVHTKKTTVVLFNAVVLGSMS